LNGSPSRNALDLSVGAASDKRRKIGFQTQRRITR